MKSSSQPVRLGILLVYLIALFCVSKFVFDTWLPPTSEKGLWFYSGLAALLLGNILVTPFFTKPVDAISYSVAALVALLAVNVWDSPKATGFDLFLWTVSITLVTLVIGSAAVSIAFKDSTKSELQNVSKSLLVLCDTMGTPRAIFSIVFLFALVAFHREVPNEYLTIGISWVFIVGLKPLESAAEMVRKWIEVWRLATAGEPIGQIVGHEIPGIALVKHRPDSRLSFGDLLILRGDDGLPSLGLALDHVGYSDGLWLRIAQIGVATGVRDRLIELYPTNVLGEEVVKVTDLDALALPAVEDQVWTRRGNLVGIVGADTNVSQMQIEVLRADLGLEEGRLLEVAIGTSPVTYQIVNGLTKEEIIQQKNTRGYVRAQAKKIGRWRNEFGRFELIKWVPRPNSPVFLVEVASPSMNRESIGHFPGTDYHVSIANRNALVTHNAAILGVLGSGKSFLALELVERLIANKVKVICLDLTNQYETELAPMYSRESEQEAIRTLQDIGKTGKEKFQQNVEEGGSVGIFKEKVSDLIRDFLAPTTTQYLRIYNPSQFEVWRQDSKPYQSKASMASLTPTEITRIITEAALETLQAQGMTDQARCCLVFEEAHSLIPEWNAVASEGDKSATNGTAKAILQGRKFGLGCLVITQRTANVTKSILNQCNTVFALRIFDATGMEFLKNYVGEDYAAILSTLEDRHAVVFGRASSCRSPVLIRLNDRDQFLSAFRESASSEDPGSEAA